MKIRTAVISVVVTGALIAGALYAAYYTVGLGKKTAVQVVPVRYVYIDLGYYYDEDSMYGTVTSRVSQNITLEADYPIEEIYVAAGDEVTEGTELFSYDMTEQEINLEALQIDLQTQQLQLKRLQKELAQYTGTSTTAAVTDTDIDTDTDTDTETASLENTLTVLTSSSGTASGTAKTDTEGTGNSSRTAGTASETAAATAVSADESTAAEESGTSDDQILDSDDTGSTGTEGDTSGGSGNSQTEDSGITIESEDYTDEQYLSYVTNYETMMAAILSYITECDGEYSAEDIEIIGEYLLGSDDVTGAVTYYRTNLAGSTVSSTTNASGETVEVTDYPLLDAVSALLSESELTTLQTAVEKMDTCHALYVDLLIGALSGKSGDDLASAVTAARAAYEYLSGEAMAQVTLLAQLESYEAQLSGGSGTESESETESGTEAEDVDIAARISAFLLMADAIFAESASPTSADYENAIAFYQMYLAAAQADIEGVEATMEGYSLSDETTAYLADLSTEGSITAAELTTEYQEICLAYVKALVSALDPLTMTSEDLTAAQTAYDRLGTAWQILVDDETPSVSDYLTAYDIVLRIQALDTTSEDFLTELSALYTEYLSLTFDQLGLIWNIDVLMEYFAQYGLLTSESESESESETEFYWDDSYDDYYDSDDSLTAEERQELIETLENQIQSQELDIRETELEVEKAQRVVDKKVVTATLDGTVVSIGDADGNFEGDYFATISNTTGLYAKGWISELALDTVNVGDTISGMTDYGDTFSAVIKEVSEYPDPYGSNYVYSGNSNASYYAFYALIEDSEGIEEGYAELTLSDAYAESSDDTFYLESYFVRNDSTGNSYVYIEGDDGTLEMRYVTTGTSLWGYYIEIKNGLSLSDYIAFPYGDSVFEGAPTEEVEELDIYDD